MGNVGVSGVILYRDEKDFILNAIDNIYPHVDELILVDDCSMDGSTSLVAEHLPSLNGGNRKCRQIMLPTQLSSAWGFGDKKNFGLAMVKHPWTLVLDADETIEDEFYKDIGDMICDSRVEVYGLPRKNYINGKWETIAYPDFQYRLFRSFCRYTQAVHEEITGQRGDMVKQLSGDGFHIIHKKTSERQLRQDRLYRELRVRLKHMVRP